MITDFILNNFGCPSELVLMGASYVFPFLPLIVWKISGKSIHIPNKPDGFPNESLKNLVGGALAILYVVYAIYAFMIPQALMGECGYAR